MARGRSSKDITTLEAALVGLELKKTEINQLIEDIKRQLGGKSSKASVATAPPAAVRTQGGLRKKRVLSAEGRKRIAAAQERRWAEHHKNTAGAKSE